MNGFILSDLLLGINWSSVNALKIFLSTKVGFSEGGARLSSGINGPDNLFEISAIVSAICHSHTRYSNQERNTVAFGRFSVAPYHQS